MKKVRHFLASRLFLVLVFSFGLILPTLYPSLLSNPLNVSWYIGILFINVFINEYEYRSQQDDYERLKKDCELMKQELKELKSQIYKER